MSALTSIRSLIRKMSAEERKVARSFLTAFQTRGTNAPNQGLKLYDLLCRELTSGENLEDRAIENLVYGKKAGTAFPRLILRLRDKLFESLLLSTNLEREGVYSERGRALHEIRKSISQAQILQSRGAWDLVISILDDCIYKAEKYEHYEELAAALRVRIEMRAVDKGKASFEEENARYTKVMRSILASKLALEYYHSLGSDIEFKAGKANLDTLLDHVNRLQQEFEATNSATVAFFLQYIEIHLQQELGRYKTASLILKRQMHLVEVHPAVHSKTRLAGVYINLAWNEIYVRKFSSALKYSTKAKGILSEKHFNRFRCYETEFHAYFYQGNYPKALEKINLLLKLDDARSAEFRMGKREYQKACVLFMLKKHAEVHKLLTALNPIENDMEGWNLALRTLYIMNDIELEKTDNAANRIENMRKHLEKLKNSRVDCQREILKFEILRTLVNTKFDFVQTRNKRREELVKLADRKAKWRWNVLTPELIIFDQWFESRVFKQKLVLNIPLYVTSVKQDSVSTYSPEPFSIPLASK